jgi:hypothetical protein
MTALANAAPSSDDKDFAALNWAEIRVAAWVSPKTDFETVLRDWLNCPTIQDVMSFGKFKGQYFEGIPTWYLTWLLTLEVTPRTRSAIDAARLHLKIRGV